MSAGFYPFSQELHDYWVNLLPPEDPFLAALTRDAAAAGIPAIAVSPDQGQFLTWLVRLTGARRILEIGTLAGYSAVCMARGQGADGELVTCEYDSKHADFAEGIFRKAGLPGTVSVKRGPALDHLPGLADGSFDLVFIDADKPNYGNYLEHSVRLLRAGGLVLVDNANAFGLIATPDLDPAADDTPRVEYLRQFSRLFLKHPGLDPSYLSIGDGVLLGRKK